MPKYAQMDLSSLGSARSASALSYKAACAVAHVKVEVQSKSPVVVIRRKGVVVSTVSVVEMLKRAPAPAPLVPARPCNQIGGRRFTAL